MPRVLFAVLSFSLGSFSIGCASTASTANVDENYRVEGSDELEILQTSIISRTSYIGFDRLVITPLARTGRRFTAETRFRVENEGTRRDASAHAELLINSLNNQHLSAAEDPAYLTVLTQPFAVTLDSKTLRDLTSLQRQVPFDFVSGMTGGNLHGLLKYQGSAKIDGFNTISITFTADGALASGPTQPSVAFSEVHMTGHAFYRNSDALLMKLVTKIVTIGSIGTGQTPLRMRVTYERALSHIPPPMESEVPQPSATSASSSKAMPT